MNGRHDTLHCTARVLAAALLSMALGSPAGGQRGYAIKGGKILTMAAAGEDPSSIQMIDHGILLIRQGKIEAIGPGRDIPVPGDYRIIDASDRWVMPGIVEAHTHIGTEGGFNDMVVPLNPELSIADGVDPEDIALKKALAGGVTTVHTMPGSGTNLGGFTVIIKTSGSSPERMIVRRIGAMKISQAYNPERRGGDLGLTRMGMSWLLRSLLDRAKDYAASWRAYEEGRTPEKPSYRPELELMRKAFAGEIPTIVHTAEAWGLMQTLRMFHDEYDLAVIATHTSFCGYLVGEEAGRRGQAHVNIGPRLVEFLRYGAFNDGRFHGMGAEYHALGVKNLSINTDAVGWSQYGVSQEDLAFQAAMSARFGLDDLLALQAITIVPARALGIEGRVGSLEAGKDADIVIKKGSLLDVTSPVDLVLVDGKIVYRREDTSLVVREHPAPADGKEPQS
jgi:imidazolonepropionase-like amidohydrolase